MATKTKTTVPHPGSACCDPAQDLAGWITAERARIARNWRWTTVLHQRGHRLRAAATKALVAGDGRLGRLLDDASRGAHGVANAYAQDALVRAGHADRVEAAHQYRLTGTEG